MNLLKLRELRLEAKEKKEYERLTFKKAQKILKQPVFKPTKTYKEYLINMKPITNHLAPPGAKPPMTYGDSHRHRRVLAIKAERGFIDFKDLPFRKDGTLNVAQYERMLKERYGTTSTNR